MYQYVVLISKNKINLGDTITLRCIFRYFTMHAIDQKWPPLKGLLPHHDNPYPYALSGNMDMKERGPRSEWQNREPLCKTWHVHALHGRYVMLHFPGRCGFPGDDSWLMRHLLITKGLFSLHNPFILFHLQLIHHIYGASLSFVGALCSTFYGPSSPLMVYHVGPK